MPVEPIPLTFGANKFEEDVGLSTTGSKLVNYYVTSTGALARAKGLTELCNFGVSYKIDGLFWWDRQQIAIAQTGGRHFKITNANGAYTEITGSAAQIGNKVYYSDFGTSLYTANRGKIIKIPSSGAAAYLTDGDAPTDVSQIASLNKRLIALPHNSETIEYSDSLAPDDWSGGFVTPTNRPDLTKAIGVANDIIEAWGTESLQGYRDDGSTPIINETQYTAQRGIGAPHSHIYIENTWYWIDHEKKVVRLNGRIPEIISLTLNKYLQSFTSVSDAIGSQTSFDGRPIYLLSFPSDGKTIAVDIYGGGWFELANWSIAQADYERWHGDAACFATKWGLHLIGDNTTGKVYKIDQSSYQTDGNILRSLVRTPVISHGNAGVWKQVRRLIFHLQKSDEVQRADDVTLRVKWSDDGGTTWSNERTINFGETGQRTFQKELRSCGRYKTRQYEIVQDDQSPVVIEQILEDYSLHGPRYRQ